MGACSSKPMCVAVDAAPTARDLEVAAKERAVTVLQDELKEKEKDLSLREAVCSVMQQLLCAAPPCPAELIPSFVNEPLPAEGGGSPLTPLCLAGKAGSLALLRALIEGFGADPNLQAPRSGYTALGLAVYGGHTEAVRYLLGRGANPTLRNKYKESALSAAEKAIASEAKDPVLAAAARLCVDELRAAAAKFLVPSGGAALPAPSPTPASFTAASVRSAALALFALAQEASSEVLSTCSLEVEIRCVSPSDGEAVRALHSTCQQELVGAAAAADFSDPAATYDVTQGRLLLLVTCSPEALGKLTPGSSVAARRPFTLPCGRYLLGFCALLPSPPQQLQQPHALCSAASNHTLCTIQCLCIDPAVRRMGLGGTLIARLESKAHLLGYTGVQLSLPSSLLPAQPMLEACSYQPMQFQGGSESGETSSGWVSLGKALPHRHVVHTSNSAEEIVSAFADASRSESWLSCASGRVDRDAALLSGAWDLCWLTIPNFKLANAPTPDSKLSLYSHVLPHLPPRLRCINRVPNPRILCTKSGLNAFVLAHCKDLEGVLPTTVVFPKGAATCKEGREAAEELQALHQQCVEAPTAEASCWCFGAAPSASSTAPSAAVTGTPVQPRKLLLPSKHVAGGVWIVKPDSQFGGKGITMHTSPEAAVAHIHAEQGREGGGGGPFVAQKYIERPLLYHGRKFHVRINVLLLDTGAVYMHTSGLVHTSSVPYALNATTEAHITNFSAQRESERYGDGESGNILSMADLWAYLATHSNISSTQLLISWKNIVGRLFGAAVAELLRCTAPVGPGTNTRVFEIFGVDLLLDEAGNTSLLEVNTNPGLSFPRVARINETFSAMLKSARVLVESVLLGINEEGLSVVGDWEKV